MPYTARDVLVRAVMSASSGLPEDTIINDFSFRVPGSGALTSGDIDSLFDAVSAFYRTVNTASVAVSAWISNFVNRSATHELQAYQIQAGPLGSPIATEAWLGPVTAKEASGMPTEVAAVLSFHAELTGILEESGATRPRARRRGRIYLGPLVPSAVDQGDVPYLLDSEMLGNLRSQAVVLKDADLGWSVWSRAASELYPVVAGWTDNAPDTQRRRGPAPTARVVWGP